jgi:hypothetical protein
VVDTLESVLKQEAGLIQFFGQPRFQNTAGRKVMQAGLEAMLKNLMHHIQPFWGVRPFPDERNLEPLRFLSLAQDPTSDPIARQLLSEYWPVPYQAVRGEDPFRLDVLFIEHAARPRHVAELVQCKKVYEEVFKDLAEREQLHLRSHYATNLPDPFNIDEQTTVGGRHNGRP